MDTKPTGWELVRPTDFYLDLDTNKDQFVILSRVDNETATKAAARIGQPIDARVVIYR
jgi:hypothetical protein